MVIRPVGVVRPLVRRAGVAIGIRPGPRPTPRVHIGRETARLLVIVHRDCAVDDILRPRQRGFPSIGGAADGIGRGIRAHQRIGRRGRVGAGRGLAAADLQRGGVIGDAAPRTAGDQRRRVVAQLVDQSPRHRCAGVRVLDGDLAADRIVAQLLGLGQLNGPLEVHGVARKPTLARRADRLPDVPRVRLDVGRRGGLAHLRLVVIAELAVANPVWVARVGIDRRRQRAGP